MDFFLSGGKQFGFYPVTKSGLDFKVIDAFYSECYGNKTKIRCTLLMDWLSYLMLQVKKTDKAACQPLFPGFVPALSIACFRVSGVIMPKTSSYKSLAIYISLVKSCIFWWGPRSGNIETGYIYPSHDKELTETRIAWIRCSVRLCALLIV